MWSEDYKFVLLLENVFAPADNTLQKTCAKAQRTSFAMGLFIVNIEGMLMKAFSKIELAHSIK
ncbi:MAG: hypothetical protein H3C64_00675 [Candidatus Kuenenia stuttgartiensis]|jgi:hypothetical protein|uniref:Uncharacterized protein n=1 Tax=Kuenenia stuttgartiensis TaxID=174633 RepID=A0A2C9CFA4_KUEST|nr:MULTISPECIES: hypothetical protein [Kuenenia]MBE7546378.1 hypothetical protein [Planctomycetia bacterium]MBW7940929.1 hypothetical protein [Candidatus Kuenenia stuttgartiensis]MBZ0191130.1 hypothetical protein [Candidatus Kuenenia stuttgartiensis]MCL4725739.1 hypothetical protein [Candidatus Kuenenia stuttgartiensis]MCZ7623404.1 hypothetical protein [Candidatus Kuenenia sp.]